MEFNEILKQRKSVRTFFDKPVPASVIEELIAAGVSAPSSCNQQLWKFVVIDDPSLKQRLIKEAFSSTLIGRAPVVMIALYDSWNYKEAIQAGSMAIMNILNKCCDLGIGACSMNSFGNEKVIKKVLNIPDHYVIVSFIVIGYSPDVDNPNVPGIPRRRVEEVLSFNGFDASREYRKSYDPEVWTMANLDDYQRYFCRKTILGKEMDLAAESELDLIRSSLSSIGGEVLDLYSYDGSYLKYLRVPKIYSLNINGPTSLYVQHAATQIKDSAEVVTIGLDDLNDKERFKNIRFVTLIMKAERISKDILEETLAKASSVLNEGVHLKVICRKSNALLNMFYGLLKIIFGDDIRKTGLYAFWGPYQPVNRRRLIEVIEGSGWGLSSAKEYFVMPAFFQQVLQMVFQYIKSGKSSYLHRFRHENFLTRTYDAILRKQGNKEVKTGGSLIVLEFTLNKKAA